MSTYIFILGKDSDLSLAELEAQFPQSENVFIGEGFAVIEPAVLLGRKEFDRLGGQIKMGEVFAKVKKSLLISGLADHLANRHDSGKLNYGISIYGSSERNLRPLLSDLKKEFRRRNISSRFANQHFLNISSAQYKGLSGGKEVLVCKSGEYYYLAETTAVQDIDAYSKRDYEKPFRNMKVGMLPPKLAQIMINLVGEAETIWDPFCGGGGLIMEGVLMGHSMLGSDINERTLEGTKKNLDWLKKEFGVASKAELFVHDATQPLLKHKFDAVVCEGYLGPPQDRLLSRAALEPLMNELNSLYIRFFEALKKTGFSGPAVIALPFFRSREGDLHLTKIVKRVAELGARENLRLPYARSNQLVGRDICRFTFS